MFNVVFLFNQLDYVIYRRVLRYYSGEEDGLGESTLPKRTNEKLLRNLLINPIPVYIQIWGKHYRGTSLRSPPSHLKGQWLPTSSNTINYI